MIRNTIAEELGMDEDEIIAAPDLAAIRIDILMGLTILRKLRELNGMDIDGDLFVLNYTPNEAERSLGASTEPSKSS